MFGPAGVANVWSRLGVATAIVNSVHDKAAQCRVQSQGRREHVRCHRPLKENPFKVLAVANPELCDEECKGLRWTWQNNFRQWWDENHPFLHLPHDSPGHLTLALARHADIQGVYEQLSVLPGPWFHTPLTSETTKTEPGLSPGHCVIWVQNQYDKICNACQVTSVCQ